MPLCTTQVPSYSKQFNSNLSLTNCVMAIFWDYLENHHTAKHLDYKHTTQLKVWANHVDKTLLVVKAHVGETRHQMFIFLF